MSHFSQQCFIVFSVKILHNSFVKCIPQYFIFFEIELYILAVLHNTKLILTILSVQCIKCIHTVVQPSPLIYFQNLFTIPNRNFIPIKQLPIPHSP